MRGKICALSGHRALEENFDENVLYDKLEQLIREGYDYFLCGMAIGFDLLALEKLVELKAKYRFEIEACIPFHGQEKSYPAREKEKYRALLKWCDKKVVLFPSYGNGVYLARDRYMVDVSDKILAYCKRETGGTAYTVRYARKKQIEVELIP